MKATLSNNEAGFTLLEALIALLLSSVILLFLSSGILQLNKINELIIADAQPVSTSKISIKGSRQIEWHLFLNQLEGYLADTQLIDYTFNSFTVLEEDSKKVDGVLVKYGRSKTGYHNFCRSKNKGYNALLTDIEDFNLEIKDQWLILNFLFENEEEYKGRIWIKSWKETENVERD